MTQLPLFPREAEARRAVRRGEGATRYLPLPGGHGMASDPVAHPVDPLGMAMADAPTGVVDFPRPLAGDPVYERLGVIVQDVPRAIRRGVAAWHRWAGAR
mgnify:FL=1